jgi:hypothetical protein
VVEQAAAGGDQLQQAATRVIVLLVRLEMLGEVGDPLSQDATWTSAEPVSPSLRACSEMTALLRSAVMDMV